MPPVRTLGQEPKSKVVRANALSQRVVHRSSFRIRRMAIFEIDPSLGQLFNLGQKALPLLFCGLQSPVSDTNLFPLAPSGLSAVGCFLVTKI
jgi:hypothetical protein